MSESFDPWGPHGFTTVVDRGRIRHIPTFDPDEVSARDVEYVQTLPHTGKHVYRTADGSLFALARGSARLEVV